MLITAGAASTAAVVWQQPPGQGPSAGAGDLNAHIKPNASASRELFDPALVNGKPVRARSIIIYRFVIQ